MAMIRGGTKVTDYKDPLEINYECIFIKKVLFPLDLSVWIYNVRKSNRVKTVSLNNSMYEGIRHRIEES